MKRQRNGECNSSKVHVKFEVDLTTKMGKKRGVIKEDQVGNKVEEESKCNEVSPASSMCSVGAAAKAAESSLLLGWDEQENWWPWLSRGIVDEQMSWGSCWLPFWDIEFMGEAYNLFFGDDIWDDDIWGIREIKEVPNP